MRKRPIRVEVYLNDEENKMLCELCRETKLNKTNLLRYLLKGYVPVEAPPADYPMLIRELRAVGNNLNQTLVIAKANGILNIPDLQKEILDLREVEKKISSQFDLK